MANELTIFQDEFSTRAKLFGDVLAPYRIPVNSFRAGVVALLEQSPYLMRSCEPMSLVRSAMSVAVQGLVLDQATGQACVVPFKGKAQPITMVRGMTTLAARAHFTLQGIAVHEGDTVRQFGGGEPRIEHEIKSGPKGRLLGTYAVARSRHFPTLFSPFISIDELMAIRDRSKGYQAAKANGNPHPWATDFEAMCIKTPKRLLSKDIPNDLLQAASWLETMHDMGRVAYLNEEGKGIIEGEGTVQHIGDPQPQPETSLADRMAPKRFTIKLNNRQVEVDTIEQWRGRMLEAINAISAASAADLHTLNEETMNDLERGHPGDVAVVREAFEQKIGAAQ
ncbi:MAG: recombinase RecT [Patescibacteria group bacterium]|nr:recombinase RecT [Patescibacteria group bacterium]